MIGRLLASLAWPGADRARLAALERRVGELEQMLPARVWQLRREPWVPDGERHGPAMERQGGLG